MFIFMPWVLSLVDGSLLAEMLGPIDVLLVLILYSFPLFLYIPLFPQRLLALATSAASLISILSILSPEYIYFRQVELVANLRTVWAGGDVTEQGELKSGFVLKDTVFLGLATSSQSAPMKLWRS